MIIDWFDPEKHEPPLGKPLLVTVETITNYREVIKSPVYYLQDTEAREKHYFVVSDLNCGEIESIRGRVVAWDHWPFPCFSCNTHS